MICCFWLWLCGCVFVVWPSILLGREAHSENQLYSEGVILVREREVPSVERRRLWQTVSHWVNTYTDHVSPGYEASHSYTFVHSFSHHSVGCSTLHGLHESACSDTHSYSFVCGFDICFIKLIHNQLLYSGLQLRRWGCLLANLVSH